jgi:HEAT repeat protein
VKDAIASPSVTADATTVGSVDAMREGPSDEEIDEALGSLSSEHGARDVRNKDWWLKNGKYVRQRLRAMIEDDQHNNTSDDWAVRILGDIGDPADVPVLAKVLTTYDYETVRWTAAEALGKNPSPDATTALIEATKMDNTEFAAPGADGLGLRKNDAAARARLEELLGHPKSTMRFHAVNALAEMGGSADALAKRKKIEKDAEVREAITKALKKK